MHGSPVHDTAQRHRHYRITARLGEGGMGAVYRATDTRLHREVAIEILPPAFSDDANRMARFEREAQTLASLNHPNIAAVYGVEQGALIMEPRAPICSVLSRSKRRWTTRSRSRPPVEAVHDRGVIAVDVTLSPQFEAGNPRKLFAARMYGGGTMNLAGQLYEPNRDGTASSFRVRCRT